MGLHEAHGPLICSCTFIYGRIQSVRISLLVLMRGEVLMDADRPIKTATEDRLGFAPVAERLAETILDQSARDGLVFGIEGEWGSGKSTLINLTISALRNAAPAPEII